MSGWDQYIQYLLADKKCESAYILGKDLANVWACSTGIAALPTYQINVEGKNFNVNEAELLVKALKNNGVPTDPNVGLRIKNEKYYTVRFDADAGTWYLKKDQGGACIAITKQALVIGTFKNDIKMTNGQPQNPGAVNAACEKLAESLKSANY
ncbi:hypothetical protein ABPG72_018125 [Tetrahymena utriculariae]